MPQAELRVTSGKQVGSAIQLPIGKFLVGREEDCHLRPNSDLVSRHHCVFTLDEYGLRLRDLGSTNGSLVNGEKIRGAVVLKEGDIVSIGKLEFQVSLGGSTGDETHTNLQDELPTEIFPIKTSEGDVEPNPQADFSIQEDETLIENTSSTETLVDIPIHRGSDGEFQVQSSPEGQATPPQQPSPVGDTQYFLPQGMPQMPVGYPPQMGYPQGMMPPYGYPGYPPQGYPGYPPNMGYPQGMYPPQQMPEQVQAEPDQQKIAEPAVRLPDPSQTGVKEPAPAPPADENSGGEKKDVRTADQKAKEEAPSAAADAIQQYLQRRPKTSG